MTQAAPAISALDRALIQATQAGLPLLPEPYRAIAQRIGSSPEHVMARLVDMQNKGIIRRIALVPNHFALGLTFNGMTVWDVDDAHVDRLGVAVGKLPTVSHCYRRPRFAPSWPYNLFAMIHARSRDDADRQIAQIAALLGTHCRAQSTLFSTRILKKTGLRI